MVPPLYHRWAAVSLIATTIGRKIYINHNYFDIIPNLFICLVGRQGFRKGTAKDIARQIFIEVFPQHPVGASVSSRDKIIELMASEDFERPYINEEGVRVPCKPMVFFINELKNFLSYNPGQMIDFLTDIYDRKFFDCSTIKRGLEPIVNPCVNILACETPRYIIDKLKFNIISGGFSRRMLFVYEIIRPPKITFPTIPPGGLEALERCKAHLRKIEKLSGPMVWESEQTRKFFDHWFRSLKDPDDEMLEGFYEAKDILTLKLAIALSLGDYEPKLILTETNLQSAIALLETVEVNLPRLTIASGRNELAVPSQKILELVELSPDGSIPEKILRVKMERDLNGFEFDNVIRQLVDTNRLYKGNERLQAGGIRPVLMTPKRYIEETTKKKP